VLLVKMQQKSPQRVSHRDHTLLFEGNWIVLLRRHFASALFDRRPVTHGDSIEIIIVI